jgi:hypothetical protein
MNVKLKLHPLTKKGEPRCQETVRKGGDWTFWREQCPNRAHTEGSDYCARHDPNVQANKAERAEEAKRAAHQMDRKEAAAAELNAWLKERGVDTGYSSPIEVSLLNYGAVYVKLEALEVLAEHVRALRELAKARATLSVEFEEDEDYAG